jgi:prepilin-type N-terminal cleavage/methylation domain-containing protein
MRAPRSRSPANASCLRQGARRFRKRRLHRLRDQGGFTVFELLVAIFILSVGVLGTVNLAMRSSASTLDNKAREGATNLSREVI